MKRIAGISILLNIALLVVWMRTGNAGTDRSPIDSTPQKIVNKTILTTNYVEALGEKRSLVYERSKDGSFGQFYDLADVFGLSENVAVEPCEMRRSAIDTAAEVRSDDSLPVQKMEALRAIQQETRDSLRVILSDEYLQAYERKVGGWIDNLSK